MEKSCSSTMALHAKVCTRFVPANLIYTKEESGKEKKRKDVLLEKEKGGPIICPVYIIIIIEH